jgi:hypothetical protein
MYKFFLYCMLVILYLGLAKALSPSELGVHYLQNEKGFSQLSNTPNTTFILIDTHATGFLIKTYYQKYRVISGYESVEDLIVRTSKEFAHRNMNNIGLSLYRRTDTREEYTPQPPGSIYIGNPEYGSWRNTGKNSLEWRFNKTFKNFPKYLGWGEFRPNQEFYKEMQLKSKVGEAYYGPNKEFGTHGSVTKTAFPHFFKEDRRKKVEMKTLLIEYFKENF